MSWADSLREDPGWGRPYIDGEGLEPKRMAVLRNKIIDKKLICASGGNVLIFLPMQNKWSVLCSTESVIFLNFVMEMDLASVNYDKAFRPYVSFLEQYAMDNIASKIPTSVCLGTSRLRVVLDGNRMTMNACEAVLKQVGSSHANVASLCYMPVSAKQWPDSWTRTDSYPMYQFIHPLFAMSPVEMKTIEWVLGNAVLDPSHISKAIVLYGEGGTGKSTLLAAVKIAFTGCCANIPDKSLVGLAKGMSNEVASLVVSNRIVTAGDVGGIDDSTNLSVIKSLTGHDYISIPPLSARSSCSLLYATNRLDDPKRNTEWTTAAIMRRVVVVMMSADTSSYIESSIPQDLVSRLDFVLRCVHTRLSYPQMPVSAMSVVLTLTGSASQGIFPYLRETDDEDITDDERLDVLAIISGAIGIPSVSIGPLARKISPEATVMVRTMECLRNVAPSSQFHELIKR